MASSKKQKEEFAESNCSDSTDDNVSDDEISEESEVKFKKKDRLRAHQMTVEGRKKKKDILMCFHVLMLLRMMILKIQIC